MKKFGVIDVTITVPELFELPNGFDFLPRQLVHKIVDGLKLDADSLSSGWGATDKNNNKVWRGRVRLNNNPVLNIQKDAMDFIEKAFRIRGYICKCNVTTSSIGAVEANQLDGMEAVKIVDVEF